MKILLKKVLSIIAGIRGIDLVPALSGLIGKIALVSSFAFVWAQELGITTPNFIFDNVRLEIIIGSSITLIMAFILPNISPPGTLAPLVVLIPAMVSFDVHPLILSLQIGIIGFISVKTKLFNRLIQLSGTISRTSLALTFGVSGIIMSINKLKAFFDQQYLPLYLLLIILVLIYTLLMFKNMTWLIIPAASIISIIIPLMFGIRIDFSVPSTIPVINPSYWWHTIWGIGFGFNIITIIKTIPFALFSILLWAIDTASVQAVIDTNYAENENREEIDLNTSFIVVSLRNIIGGMLGGAQTSSLWRSFLIPLYIVKRPIQGAAILLGILGIFSGIIASPIRLLSFPPLIWTVLLFGIFVPFVFVGVKNIRSISVINKTAIIILALIGVYINPIFAWIGAILFEKTSYKLLSKKITSCE